MAIARAQIDLTAKDRVTGVGKRVLRVMTGVQQGFERVGRAARMMLTIGAGAIGGLMALSAHQEKQERLLAQTVTSTGHAAGFTAEQMYEQAAALQKVTTYGDEAIMGAQRIMATFTQVRGDQFEEATKAVLDLSTSLGTDLKSSAIMVGKALNDPAVGMTAMSRAGITFSDQQKAVVKQLQDTGRTAEAQKVILGELNKQFGGQASAAADTFAGRMQQVKNELGDVGEELGTVFMPMLEDLAAWVKEIIPKIREWVSANQENIKTWVKWAVVLGIVIIVVPKIIMLIKGIIVVVKAAKVAMLALKAAQTATFITSGIALVVIALVAVIAMLAMQAHETEQRLKAMAEANTKVADASTEARKAVQKLNEVMADPKSTTGQRVKALDDEIRMLGKLQKERVAANKQAIASADEESKKWFNLGADAAASFRQTSEIYQRSFKDTEEDLAQKKKLLAQLIALKQREDDLNRARVLEESKLKTIAVAVSKVTDKLKEQIATFGLSSEAVSLHKLKLAGASAEQLKNVHAMQAQLEVMRTQTEERKKATDEETKLIDTLKTRYQALWEQQQLATGAMAEGQIELLKLQKEAGDNSQALRYVEGIKRLMEQIKSIKASKELDAEAQALREQLRTAEEIFVTEKARYDLLLARRKITAKEHAKALAAAKERAKEKEKEKKEEGGFTARFEGLIGLYKRVSAAAASTKRSDEKRAADAAVKGAVAGEKTAKGVADSNKLLKDIKEKLGTAGPAIAVYGR